MQCLLVAWKRKSGPVHSLSGPTHSSPVLLSIPTLGHPQFVHRAPGTLARTLFPEHTKPDPTMGSFHLRFL